MITEQDLRGRVALGVKWLDDNHAGWRDHIDIKELDLISCNKCVLGQMFGSFESVIDDDKDRVDGDKLLSIDDAYAMGFSVSFTEKDSVDEHNLIWGGLTDLWREAILA